MTQYASEGIEAVTAIGKDGTASVDAVASVFHVRSDATPSLGTVLVFDAVASTGVITSVFLWCSSDGKLRISTTFPTSTESGTVVGSQS